MARTRRQSQAPPESEADREHHSPSQAPQPSESVPSHGYGTRRSSHTARPAFALGLHKRTQAEIRAEAQKKRAALQEKKRIKEQKAQHVADGARQLARLEDERIVADVEEDRFLSQSFSDIRAEQVSADGNSLQDTDAALHAEEELPRYPEDDPELPMDVDNDAVMSDGSEAAARRRAVREGKKRAQVSFTLPPSPPPLENVSDDDSPDDELADYLRELRNQDVRTAKAGESSKSAPSNPADDSDDSDYSCIPRPRRRQHFAPAASESDESDTLTSTNAKRLRFTRSVVDNDDDLDLECEARKDIDEEQEQDEPISSQLTRADRRGLKRTTVRGQIAAHRTELSPSTVKKHTSITDQESIPSRNQPRTHTGSAFRSRWESTASEPLPDPPRPTPRPKGSSTATPARASSHRRSSAPSTSRRPASAQISQGRGTLSRTPSSSRSARFDRRMMEPNGSDVEHDAFRDDDVSFSRDYAVKMASRKRKTMVSIQPDLDDDVVTTQVIPKKRKRNAKTPVPEEKSRSATLVPDFVKRHLFTEIIPTILEYFGAKTDPWNAQEHGPDELLDLSQELLNDLCPRAEYRLSKNDVIYKVIQQEVYEWCSRFASAVISAINDAIYAAFGPNPRCSDVQAWIREATSDGGAALWGRPNRNPRKARGSLQSPYVLRSFATHLAATNGSVYLYGPPVGALSLASTAVQHVFAMYKTGKFIPGRAFSAANVGYLTESWYKKSVERFARKEAKFAKLARKASQYATSQYQTKARTGADALQAPDIFDRSSPPLEDTDEETTDDSNGDDD